MQPSKSARAAAGRTPRAKQKSQSAIEYLMTYGWTILVAAVVLTVLYLLGAFNPSVYASTFCTLSGQLSCNKVILAYNGNLLVNIGQSAASTISVTSVGCNTNGTISNMQTSGFPVNIITGSNATVLTKCYENGSVTTKRVGSLYSGYLIINYTNPGSGFSHTVIGTLIVKASTGVVLTTTSTSSSTTSITTTFIVTTVSTSTTQ